MPKGVLRLPYDPRGWSHDSVSAGGASPGWNDESVTACVLRECEVRLLSHHSSIGFYARGIKPLLSAHAFRPARSRLLFVPFHLALVASAILAIDTGALPLVAELALSCVIGVGYAGLTFVAHEALHGAIVRGRAARYLVGWLGFLPFAVSPTLWLAWHNRVHHGHTNHPDIDPDAYPTLTAYRGNGALRFVTDQLAPGRGRPLSMLGMCVGFSVQSLHMLIVARHRGYLTPPEHRRAILETTLAVGVWIALAFALGPAAMLLCFALPLLVANALVMSMILTNHSLSPLTDVNDPLSNSLSVTAPRWFEWLTLRFGYHVEHHLFPAMSSRNAHEVRDAVRSLWPERYQSLPLWKALARLYRSPRVYKTRTTLVDPTTGREWPALSPRPQAECAPTTRLGPSPSAAGAPGERGTHGEMREVSTGTEPMLTLAKPEFGGSSTG
jgi:fatty acid desaturase